MRDFELYQAVLDLRPLWTVVNVELDVKRHHRHRRGWIGAASVSGVSGGSPGLRSETPTMAASGYLPIDDLDSDRRAASDLSDPWDQANRRALGRVRQSVHRLVRTVGHRPAPRVLGHRGRQAAAPHLGCGVGNQGAGRRSGTESPDPRRGASPGCR